MFVLPAAAAARMRFVVRLAATLMRRLGDLGLTVVRRGRVMRLVVGRALVGIVGIVVVGRPGVRVRVVSRMIIGIRVGVKGRMVVGIHVGVISWAVVVIVHRRVVGEVG